MTILIDIDDTIENLCEEWCKLLNKKYECNVDYKQVTDWDISKFFPNLTREQVFEPLHHPEIWYLLKPKKGATKYIKKLIDDGNDIYLCTSTDYRNIKPKYEGVIQRYFPYIKWSQVIVTSNKQMIKADILIDDGVHNLVGGDYKKILITAPHNSLYNAEANGMYRADNWKSVYKTIKSIRGMNEN